MSENSQIRYHTELSANITGFCRFLRDNGIPLGPLDQVDALRAMETMPFSDQEVFRLVLRAVLTKSQSDQIIFDDLFPEYWKDLALARDSKVRQDAAEAEQKENRPPNSNKQSQPQYKTLKDWLQGKQTTEEQELAAYSPVEVLTRKDFSTLSEDDLQEVMKLINIIAKSLATKFNRRFKPDQNKGIFDLRRTMRLNMRRGGEIMELGYQRRKIRKLKLVMICDVSKSMDLYSRFLVQFIYAFQSAYRRIETFVFSTSLHRVTDEMQNGRFSEVLQRLAETVPGWSGGTKIGTSLKTFVDEYGRQLLNDRTVVLIMSDGWDTGDIENLEGSMAQIQQKAAKVVWLNPLAGSPKFEPSVRGMQAALPYIDVFAPVHSLESLRNLVKYLGKSKRFMYQSGNTAQKL